MASQATAAAPAAASAPQLPPNWQQVYDGTSGQVYYWNSVTDETSWEAPQAFPEYKPEVHSKRVADASSKISSNVSTKERLAKLAKLRKYRDARRAAMKDSKKAMDAEGADETKAEDEAVQRARKPKKKAQVIMAESYDETEKYVKQVFPKQEASKEVLRSVLKSSFIFEGLASADIEEVVDCMKERKVRPGDNVITQGESGDNFYIVESGDFDIIIDGVGKVAERGAGASFGEKALLYNCPRAATVRATTGGRLWALGRAAFRHMIAHTTDVQFQEIVGALRVVPILQSLSDAQLARVAEAVKVTEYHKNDIIIRKGDVGDKFYMIKSGNVLCTDIGNGVADLPLGAGAIFGERALLMSEPRAANVIATGDVVCFELDRQPFTELLGPLHSIIDEQLRLRVLRAVPALEDLTDKQRDAVVRRFTTAKFKAGDTIATQGAAEHTLLVVKEGEATVVAGSSRTPLKSGEHFGEEALVSDALRAAGVVAETDVEMFVLSREHFLAAMETADEENKAEETKEAAAAEDKAKSKALNITFDELELIRTLGEGTFGRVKLVRHKPTNTPYALKMLQKQRIVDFKQTKNVMNEKNVMAMINHPFILKLAATFKDKDSLYMLLELVSGGELFTLLANTQTGYIPSSQAIFYGACVVSGLAHLHERNILYRDLKPENMLLDAEGYIKIVDMGFAKIVPERTYTLCGTPEYLAPELVLGKGHHKGVDYWATGILIYEMLCGYTPFADDDGDQVKICKHIVKSSLKFPKYMKDRAARDLIGKLLKREPIQRLGCRKAGADEIRQHKWFKTMNWETLVAKEQPAPWTPGLKDPFDCSHFDDYEEDDSVTPYRGDESWHADF